MELQGEVHAGREWNAPLGEGWIFRVLPIAPSSAGYSGWDLVVDRDPPAGYPDALLLATLPYHSINEREIGTTFSLRAQDAIGWNPRTFRFLVSPGEFREAQKLFRQLTAAQTMPAREANASAKSAGSGIMPRLLQLESGAASGQLRILDARLVPGIADPHPFAQAWAVAFSQTQHEIESTPPGQETAAGNCCRCDSHSRSGCRNAGICRPDSTASPCPVPNNESRNVQPSVGKPCEASSLAEQAGVLLKYGGIGGARSISIRKPREQR